MDLVSQFGEFTIDVVRFRLFRGLTLAEVSEIMTKILFHEVLLLMIFDKVADVKLDPIIDRVCVVKHSFIEVICEIHGPRVPPCVFKIYEDYLSQVVEGSQNVVLLGVVMRKYCL